MAQMIQEGRGADGLDPIKEAHDLRAQIEAIHKKVSVVLDGITEAAASAVKENVDALGHERRRLEARLGDLETKSVSGATDEKAIAAELRASLARLSHVREQGTPEQQKTFLRNFIDRIEVNPRCGRAQVCVFGEIDAASGAVFVGAMPRLGHLPEGPCRIRRPFREGDAA